MPEWTADQGLSDAKTTAGITDSVIPAVVFASEMIE